MTSGWKNVASSARGRGLGHVWTEHEALLKKIRYRYNALLYENTHALPNALQISEFDALHVTMRYTLLFCLD